MYYRVAKTSLTAAKFKEKLMEDCLASIKKNYGRGSTKFYTGEIKRNKNGNIDWTKLMPKIDVFNALGWKLKIDANLKSK